MVGGIYGYSSAMGSLRYDVPPVDNISKINPNDNSANAKALKRSGTIECKTCSQRKYKDGSDEMVSFKSAAHISPSASASTVRAHEQEHVSNAYNKADLGNGEVISASVSLKTAVCPECGRTYVSGGTTSTQIKYNEDNPYEKNQKQVDAEALAGQYIDCIA